MERVHGMQKVARSNRVGSMTNKAVARKGGGLVHFRRASHRACTKSRGLQSARFFRFPKLLPVE